MARSDSDPVSTFLSENHVEVERITIGKRAMAIPATVLHMVGYEQLRDIIRKHYAHPEIQEYSPFLAGAVSRSK
jgi:hypothetical protein